MSSASFGWALRALVVAVAWAATQEWLVAVELGTLLFGLGLLLPLRQYPLLPIAVVAEWIAVTAGPLYFSLTGRRIPELRGFDPTVVVAVGCAALTAQFIGLRIGFGLSERKPSTESATHMPLGWLVGAYVLMSLVQGALPRLGIQAALSAAQIIIGLHVFRLLVVYMLVARLMQRRAGGLWVALISIVEIVVLPYGWMADFMAPMVLVGAAVFAHLRLKPMTTQRWLVAGSMVSVFAVLLVMWTGIKPRLRRATRYIGTQVESNRLSALGQATEAWLSRGAWKHDSDALVSRLWALYYPGLAFRRIPSSLPHTEGALIAATLRHIVTPRFLFPDKPTLVDADSNMVRRYAGVWVGGTREQTSIAYGRFGESYVDFGLWGVVLLELGYGFLIAIGLGQVGNRIRQPELRRAVTATLGLSLCVMQASWTITLGPTVMAFLLVGVGAILIDHYVLRRSSAPLPALETT